MDPMIVTPHTKIFFLVCLAELNICPLTLGLPFERNRVRRIALQTSRLAQHTAVDEKCAAAAIER
jgi:hypothetical protein